VNSYLLYCDVPLIRRWTSRETNTLKSDYADTPSRELAKYLNRSPKAIRNKASRLSLRALHRNWSFPRPIKDFTPSANLAYLIGAIKGDGYILAYRGKSHPYQSMRYYIGLRAVDFEFVSQVRGSIGEVLGRFPKIGVYHQHRNSLAAGNRIFRVSLCDKSLFTLLKQTLEQLKSYIETYPAHFLRGFFDADGSAFISRNEATIKYSNTNRELMQYTRKLLVTLQIRPSPKMVEERYVYINKKKLLRPKPLYSLYIHRKKSVITFMRTIGSSIPRKRLTVNV